MSPRRKSNHPGRPTRAELETDLARLRRQWDRRSGELEVEALRQAHRETEASRENFLELYDFAPVGHLTLDRNGVIRTSNFTAADFIGTPRGSLVGRPFLTLVSPRDRRRFLSQLGRLRRGQPHVTIELELQRRNGLPVTVQMVSVASVTGKRQAMEFRTALVDITERKRAEARTTALAKLALVLSGVAEPEAAARAVVDTALEYCGWDACFLLLHDPQTDTVTDLVNMDTIGGQRVAVPPMLRGRPPSRLVRQVMQEGPHLILRKSPADPGPMTTRFGDTTRVSLSLMFVPVRAEGRTIGVLSVQSYQLNAYTHQDLAVLQGLADHVGGTLARLQAEAALRRANEQLEARVAERTAEVRAVARYARNLIEVTPDPLVTISPAGKITDVNEATEQVTGVARARLIGSDFSSYFTEPDQAAAGYQKVLAEGQVRDYPLTIQHVSGRVTEVLYHATVFRNDGGQVQGVLAAARDITDRVLLERRREFTNALLRLFARKTTAREYLEAAVRALRDWSDCEALGIRLAGENGALPYRASAGFPLSFLQVENRLSLQGVDCFCMRAVTHATERRSRALVTAGGSYRCDDAIAFASELTPEQRAYSAIHCVASGFRSVAVVPIRYRDEIIGVVHLADRRAGRFTPGAVEFLEALTPLIGEAVRWFETEAKLAEYRDHLEELVRQRTSALEAANEQLRKEIASRQVAEEALQRTAQELKRSNLELEQFAYVASHDLQEPLRAVGGYVRLLELRFPDKMDPKVQEYIAGAAEGAVRMEQQIADLLALSRVGTHGGGMTRANLSAPLNAALQNLQFTIRNSKATVTADPLPVLNVDESQIVQLFQNLIANAVKFHGENPPAIHVGARAEQDRWVISVRDNGIGIDPQYFERIFQVFQRLHTRKKYPGTGVGLAICRKIVERHGGRLWVESEPGQGSTFFFSLPAGADPQPGAA